MKKGLSCRSSLVNGGFQLTGGGQKASDNVYFLMTYTFLRKIYYPDFNPGTAWLMQKPTSFLNVYKTLLLGRVKQAIEKYVDDVKVDNMALFYDFNDRKQFVVYTSFTHTEPGSTTNSHNVTFI